MRDIRGFRLKHQSVLCDRFRLLAAAWTCVALLGLLCTGTVRADDDDPPALEILDVVATTDPFSPNADGVNDSTTFQIQISVGEPDEEEVLKVETIIRDSLGFEVRTLTSIHSLLETDDDDGPLIVNVGHLWDGRDDQGGGVPDGTYSFEVNASLHEEEEDDEEDEVEATAVPVDGIAVS